MEELWKRAKSPLAVTSTRPEKSRFQQDLKMIVLYQHWKCVCRKHQRGAADSAC